MKRDLFTLAFIMLMVVTSGCSKNDPSRDATRLRISLTDAPISIRAEAMLISEMNIDIQKIEVSAIDSTSTDENWTAINYNGGVYNILQLSNGKSKQLSDQYFSSGVLKNVRIFFGENSTIRSAGQNKPLLLDPSAKDGVVVPVNANLYANYVTNIMIDINAAMSLYVQNDNFYFKPNIRGFAETYGGSLKGYVSPLDASPQVVVTNDIDTLFTIPEMTDGMFKFLGMTAGKWDIHVFADPESGYRDTIFSDSIISGRTTEVKSIALKKIDVEEE